MTKVLILLLFAFSRTRAEATDQTGSVTGQQQQTTPWIYDALPTIPCKWIGHAPICGYWDCRNGQVEKGRSDVAIGTKTEFGSECSRGQKTLCCKADYDGPI